MQFIKWSPEALPTRAAEAGIADAAELAVTAAPPSVFLYTQDLEKQIISENRQCAAPVHRRVVKSGAAIQEATWLSFRGD